MRHSRAFENPVVQSRVPQDSNYLDEMPFTNQVPAKILQMRLMKLLRLLDSGPYRTITDCAGKQPDKALVASRRKEDVPVGLAQRLQCRGKLGFTFAVQAVQAVRSDRAQ
ncbi:MAG TPA: hypothetical protein VFV02_15345 [Acidimicrobiales bacterium]|nr:hypothetical protein [Acidimicrobiales bacterium]